MPLYRRLPKRGFNSVNKNRIALINLFKLEKFYESKKISSLKISLSELKKSNIINKKYEKIKLLGSGSIKSKFDVEVNYISKSAKEKIEKQGGKVTLIK